MRPETDSQQEQCADEPLRRSTVLEQLYSERNGLQQRLDRIDKQIKLLHQNPVIVEFLDLGRRY